MNPMDFLRVEFGTLSNLGKLLGIRANTIYLWGRNNVPTKYIKQIEGLSEGRVTKEMLRPDLFGK